MIKNDSEIQLHLFQLFKVSIVSFFLPELSNEFNLADWSREFRKIVLSRRSVGVPTQQ